MKRWMISMLCLAWISLSACDADPDVILQNDVSVTEREDVSAETVLTDGTEGTDAAEDSSPEGTTESASEDSSEGEQESGSAIFVYICGAVNSPGVYELESGDRIYRLVELAGGLTEDAAQQSINLAQTVEDGEMVYVPTVEESAGETASSEAGSVSSDSAQVNDSKVNINTATAAELTVLNGIGDAKAEAIVAYREEHGAFGSTEEIMQVAGIGEATYNKIKDEITV